MLFAAERRLPKIRLYAMGFVSRSAASSSSAYAPRRGGASVPEVFRVFRALGRSAASEDALLFLSAQGLEGLEGLEGLFEGSAGRIETAPRAFGPASRAASSGALARAPRTARAAVSTDRRLRALESPRGGFETVTARERTVRADGVCGDASSRFRTKALLGTAAESDWRRRPEARGDAAEPGDAKRVGAFSPPASRARARAPAARRGDRAGDGGGTGGGGGGDALRARRGDCRVPGRARDVPARFTRVNCSARLSSAAAAAPTLLCGEQKKSSVSGVSGDRSRAEGSEGLRAESSWNAARAPAVAGEGGRVLGRRILEGVTRAAESVARHVLQER